MIGEALAKYLDEAGSPPGAGSFVEKSRGAIGVSREQLAALMEEQDDFLGA